MDTPEPDGSAPKGAVFPEILTTAMAAEMLHVHVEYLRRMVREDRIPAHRFPGGREIRFLREELIAWVKAQPGEDRSPSAGERTGVNAPDLGRPNLSGKVVVVTGGNSGIGKQAALELAGMGATVVIAARNPQKAAAAVKEIQSATGAGDRVDTLPIDLASFASVHAFAAAFAQRHDRLDVLLNNAGLVLQKRVVTEDGHETQFQTNHLSHFMLTQLLRPQLEHASHARVVNVASGAHNAARKGLDFDDLEWERRRYRGFSVYACTKLMNIYFTRELSKRWEATGITANALHPGFVASNFAKERDYGIVGNVFMPLSRPFSISVPKGAQTSIYLASSPDVDGISGQYFFKNHVGGPSAAALDDNAAARLWEISEKLTI